MYVLCALHFSIFFFSKYSNLKFLIHLKNIKFLLIFSSFLPSTFDFLLFDFLFFKTLFFLFPFFLFISKNEMFYFLFCVNFPFFDIFTFEFSFFLTFLVRC